MRTLIAALALAVTPLGGALAQGKETPPSGGKPKDFTLPAKREFTLPNGMQVTLVPVRYRAQGDGQPRHPRRQRERGA